MTRVGEQARWAGIQLGVVEARAGAGEERSPWIGPLVPGVTGAVVAPPLIDRFGVVDGVLRLMALVVVVLVALDVVRVALARWTVLRPTRSWSADHRLRVVALAGFAALYLAGVALDDEPGPGGALCATGLGLLGLAVVAAPLVARVRP